MQQQLPEEGGLLGPLSPGERKLEGKCFYLDSVKSRSTALLVEAISLLGGKVESFLHKDVSCVVTGSREVLKEQKSVVTKAGTNWKNEETLRPTKLMGSVLSNDKQRPGTPRPMGCGSRGKALLEKAIRNNERQQGSSVLANACSWGVKILFVDVNLFLQQVAPYVILYLKQLTRESFNAKHKKSEKTYTKHRAACVVKAAALRSPYLKVEDLSRKYKPLYMQSMTFPTLCYSGRFSPFEPPPPPRTEKLTEQGKNKTRERNKAASSVQDIPLIPLSCNPSPWRARKKDLAYCECCRQPFTNQEEHLQSDQHRSFVLDSSSYSVVDQLVADMQPGFNPSPSQQSEAALNCLQVLPPIQDASLCELEPLTDIETEHAIQALLTQGSSFNTQIPSHIKPLSSSPAAPQPDVQPPTANLATPLADSHTDSQSPDRQSLSPSPAIPLPDALPLTHCSAIQLSDTEHLSTCPDTLCQSPDPYSLPPVLSPQDPCHILEPHSPYSEPPVLSPQVLIQCPSPQQYTAEEDMEALESKTKTVQIVSQCVPVPISTPLLPPVGVNRAERVKGSNQEGLILGFSGLMHSNNSLECTGLASRRSHSLPQMSMTTPNPKKRCRSASPEHNPNKRRRTSLTFGDSACCTGQGHKSFVKSENDIMPMAEAYLLFDKLACQIPVCNTMDCMPTVEQVYVNKNLRQGLSFGDTLPTLSACTMEKLGTKQPAPTTFLVPNVQNLTQLPNQIRYITGLSSTSGAGQPLWPVSTNTRILDPPLYFPSDKSHCTLSSQDSHPSLSHSISSVCIESTLVPDMATLSPSSSDSDWDCELLSRLGPTLAAPLPPTEGSCGLDRELLQRPCTWMHDTSYESRLHTVLQPSTPTASLCGEEMDPSAFSRTVVQIVEVLH